MVEQFDHKEKEPGSPKVVCFEGISCCGKSTLIDGLASPDRGIEVVRFQVPRDLKYPTPEYFLANDTEKLKKSGKGKWLGSLTGQSICFNFGFLYGPCQVPDFWDTLSLSRNCFLKTTGGIFKLCPFYRVSIRL